MPNDVLIVDDDKGITDLLTMLLTNHGFNISAANTAAEGLEHMKENVPDLIILDMIMPDMNGWDTCKAIRTVSNVPILILSPLDDPRMIASILDAGADDFLIKPVPSSVLVAHMKKLIRRTGGLELSPLQPSDAQYHE
jgi:DNA-binding response OmpR family regulator